MTLLEKLNKALDVDDIVFATLRPEQLDTIRTGLLSREDDPDRTLLYITTNRPYATLKDELAEEGIATDNIFFIDCMSKQADDVDPVRHDDVVFLEPDNLSNISIAVSEAIENLPHDSSPLIVLDTLSALEIFNDEQKLLKFSHFLINKMRGLKAKSVLLALEEETDSRLTSQIGNTCDCLVELAD